MPTKPKTSETFAAKLARLRAEMGWTQADLAARAGVMQHHVSRWESGLEPTMPTLRRLAAALGVEPGELV